jgi:tol-pal system protein YbgF
MARALRMLLVAVAIASAACASRTAVRELRRDVDRLAGSVTLLKTEQSLAPARDETLRREIGGLATQMTTNDTRAAEAREQLARLDARLAAAEQLLRDTGAKIDAIQATVTKLEASEPSPKAAIAAPQRDGGAPPSPGPEDAYASALATFRAREHGQAVLDFLDFLSRHPTHELAPAAQYWIGEAYFVQRDYRQAIAEFEKVLEYGLHGTKAPDALVRAGMAWQRLRDVRRARELWQRVMREYPRSSAAQQARTLLAGVTPSSAAP